MTIEETFQEMLTAAYPAGRDPGARALHKQQILDLRRAFFGGVLIGWQRTLRQEDYINFVRELTEFPDLVDAGLR